MAGTWSFEDVSLSTAEVPTALPVRCEWDLSPVWKVTAAPDEDGDWWDKHWSRTPWVTEIPSGFDPFLAPAGSGGSNTLLSALFSKDFSLGSSEVFPAASLWFQSLIYSRQWQTCREMTLCCQSGLQGQWPAPQVCSEGFSSGAPWDWFSYASCGFAGFNTKFLERKYLSQELKKVLEIP